MVALLLPLHSTSLYRADLRLGDPPALSRELGNALASGVGKRERDGGHMPHAKRVQCSLLQRPKNNNNSEGTHNGSEGGSSSGSLKGSCGVMRREELVACLAAALRASDHLLDGLDSTLHPAHRAPASSAPADSMYTCGGPLVRSGGAVLQGEQVVLLFERINALSLSCSIYLINI